MNYRFDCAELFSRSKICGSNDEISQRVYSNVPTRDETTVYYEPTALLWKTAKRMRFDCLTRNRVNHGI